MTLIFQFDIIRNEGGSETHGRSITRSSSITISACPGCWSTVMGASRQRADYQANADAEWNAYLAALEAAAMRSHRATLITARCLQTLPIRMAPTTLYKAAVDAINAAVTALDAKVKPTNAAAVADLKATIAGAGRHRVF